MFTQDQLKEILHYNSETGIFTWVIPRGNKMKIGDTAGTINKKGYVMIYYKMKCYISHRLAWLYMTGDYPDSIDHIDGVRSNNKFSNLRSVGILENARNRKKPSNNTSGHCGVFYDKSRKCYVAFINVLGKLRTSPHLNIDDAIAKRKQFLVEARFHKNHGRD